jgi:short-subunit dehydrogenase
VIPQLSPEQAAKYIVTGIERDKQTIMEPWQLRSIVAMAKFFPKMVK